MNDWINVLHVVLNDFKVSSKDTEPILIDVVLLPLLLILNIFSTAFSWLLGQLKDSWNKNLVCWNTYYNPFHHSYPYNRKHHHIFVSLYSTLCCYHMQPHDLYIFSSLRVKGMLFLRVRQLKYARHRPKCLKPYIDVRIRWTNNQKQPPEMFCIKRCS